MGMVPTLCWECRRSCQDKCSWAEDFIPVKGWTAKRQDIEIYGQRAQESYLVEACPEFDPSPTQAPDLDADACADLLGAVADLARKDYIYNVQARPSIEWWFEGQDEIIKQLREEAAEADARGRRDRVRKE